MQDKLKIKDIAAMLNVSVSTVSRAFRDTHDVNPGTRKKVLALAKELHFSPNKNAAALASGKTGNIGIVLPFITNYYYSKVISGIQDMAYSMGYNIILYITNDDHEREKELIANLAVGLLDGVLISISSRSTDHSHFEALLKKELPVVFFDRVPSDNIAASRVVQNDFQGAYEATCFLLKNGYKKIAHITGPPGLNLTKQRLLGYRKALADHDIPLHDEDVIFSGFSQEDGMADVELLLTRPAARPDAIFAVNDRKAIGAILALKSRGIDVGAEIAVIGFTNDPMGAIIEPKLTTMEEPAFDIGKKSCELLIHHIRNKRYDIRELTLSNNLIIRDSVRQKQ